MCEGTETSSTEVSPLQDSPVQTTASTRVTKALWGIFGMKTLTSKLGFLNNLKNHNHFLGRCCEGVTYRDTKHK